MTANASTGQRVLGLFAKRPEPGRVKTRLAEAMTPEKAAEVAHAFLLDSLQRLGAFPAHRVLAFEPAGAISYFEEMTAGRFFLRPQCTGDLGRRMAAFFEEQFQTGASKVLLVGADSPTLPLSYLEL